MAENVWSLLDGRSILVQFETPQAATNWGWFGNRGGDGLEFATPTTPWAEWDWLCGGGMIQAADGGGGLATINASANITLEDAVASSSASLIISGGTSVQLDDIACVCTASLSINAAASIQLEDTTATSSASLALDGSTSMPLEDVICIAAASLQINAVITIQLEDATASAEATIGGALPAINAEATITLEDAVCTISTTISQDKIDQPSYASGGGWMPVPQAIKRLPSINAQAHIQLEDVVCNATGELGITKVKRFIRPRHIREKEEGWLLVA